MKAADIKSLSFYGATGFGDVGRGVSIELANGDLISGGVGATDEEAVVDTLAYEIGFDAAFDLGIDVSKSIKAGAIRVIRAPGCPN